MTSNATIDLGMLSPTYDKYKDQTSFFAGGHPLDLGVGYFVVLGFGLLFSIATTFLVWLSNRYGKQEEVTSEHFK
jgi:hypothetical protein